MTRPFPNQGDLSRAKTLEPDTEFPDYVEVRLVWGNKARYHRIMADEFFGWGGHGAPMSGDTIVRHIDRLRRLGDPSKEKTLSKDK